MSPYIDVRRRPTADSETADRLLAALEADLGAATDGDEGARRFVLDDASDAFEAMDRVAAALGRAGRGFGVQWQDHFDLEGL